MFHGGEKKDFLLRMPNKRKPKYDSSRNRDDYTLHPGRLFQLEWTTDPGQCRLYALDDHQAALLRIMCSVFPKYYWVWGLPSPQREWDAATQQLWEDINDFVDELEAILVNGCDLQAFIDAQVALVQAQNEQTKAIRQLTAVLGSQSVDLDTPIPTQLDYTQAGIANLLNVLQSRFVMPDASIWNLLGGGEKNVPETLETLFRLDAAYDLELYTNVTSVLDSALKIGDANLIGHLKNFIRALVARKNLPGEFGTAFEELLEDDRLSVADILLMIATADGDDGKRIANAIKNISQTINLNNYNGCCDEDDCNCDEADIQTFNLLDLCEQDTVIDVNGNGNGQV